MNFRPVSVSSRILSKSIPDNFFDFTADPAKNQTKMVSDLMKLVFSEDISRDRLSWIVEHVDEMFSEEEEDENDTL